MFDCEILVRESFSIDGLASSAVMIGEISSLGHEARDDAMEMWLFEAKSFLMSAESSEVSCCFRGFFIEQLEDQLLDIVFAKIQFEEHVLECHQ